MGEDTPAEITPVGQEVTPVVPHPEAPTGETAQNIGEAAIDPAMQPPLATEHAINGPDPSIDPVTGQKKTREEEPETRVQDEELAHVMALAGDSARSEAAGIRRGISAEKEFKDKLHAIVEDPRYLDGRFKAIFTQAARDLRASWTGKSPGRYPFMWGKQLPTRVSKWSLEELEQLDEHKMDAVEDLAWRYQFDPIFASGNVLRGDYAPEDYDFTRAHLRERYDDLDRARRMDERAHRDEEWARLLHEKPVSEEYKAANPDFGFGLYEMERLEDTVERRDGLEYSESYLDEERFAEPERLSFVTIIESLQGAVEKLISVAGEAANERDLELITQYEAAMTDKAATLGSLVDINKQIRQRHNEIIRARAEERKRVLDDVKTGRASQPPQPPAEQQAA